MSTAVLPCESSAKRSKTSNSLARVERRGRLVEDQDVGIAHVGAGDGDLLPLAAGELDAGLEAPSDELVVARRQALDHLVGEAAPRRFADALAIVAGLDPADGDVLAGGQVVAHEVLEDDADVAAQRGEVVIAQVAAVEQDPALVRVVEPRQELDQRRLAGAVLADQRQHLAGPQLEGEVAHRPALGPRVAEADVFEDEALADRLREGQRIGRRGDLRREVEEREEVVEIERLAGDLREADQQPFEEVAQAAE